MKPWRSFPVLAALLVFAVHLVIAHFFALPGTFRKYTAAAEQYLAGDLPRERLVDFSPLYFEASLLATRLTDEPEAWIEGLQFLLVALAAGFLAALLERRFGRPLAIFAIAVFAFDRHVLAYERVLEPEAFLLAFVLGWFFFLERSHEAPPERRWHWWLGAGLAAAAALATRPTFLPLFLLVPLYLKWRGEERFLRGAAVFALPIAVVFALLMLRTAAVTGDPRSPVMNPGTVFYEGNNALSEGTSAMYPPIVQAMARNDETRPDVAHENYRVVARAAARQRLSVAAVNAYWSGLTLDHVRARPVRFLALLRNKALLAFHGYRWHDVSIARHYEGRLFFVPALPFAVLGALALVGLLLEARRFAGPAFLFYLLAAAQLGVMLVFYVSARQRLVMLPAFLYFAAVTVEHFGQASRQARLALGAFLALLVLTLALPGDAARDDAYTHERRRQAQALLDELREKTTHAPLAAHADLALDALVLSPWVEWMPAYFPQERQSVQERLAERLAERARETEHESVPERFDRAVAFLRAGRFAAAEELFEALAAEEGQVYRGAAQPSLPRFYLGRLAGLRGDRAAAVAWLEAALERSPGNPFVLAELVALTGDEPWEAELRLGTSELDGLYLLGRAHLAHGQAREAVAVLEPLIARLPQFRSGRIHLAAALGAVGRIDEGASHYIEAVRHQPDPLILSPQITALFRRWAELHPEEPMVQLFAARILHEHGRFHEAAALLERLEPLDAWPSEIVGRARQEKARLEKALAALE